MLTALLGALAWFAPWLVAKTPALQWLVDRATAESSGTFQVGNASLGWLSHVELGAVEVRDAEGQTILHAASIKWNRSLIDLVRNPSDLGVLEIDQPALHLTYSAASSNLEDVLAPWLLPSDEPSQPVNLTARVTNGSLHLKAADGRAWEIAGLNATVEMPDAAEKPIEVSAAGNWKHGDQPGLLEAKLSLWQQTSDARFGNTSGRLNARLDAFPLWSLEPLLLRLAPGTLTAGRLSGQVNASWGAAGTGAATNEANVDGRLQVDSLQLRSPWLNDDLALAQIDLPCRAALRKDTLQIDQATLTTDVGQVQVNGQFPASLDNLWAALTESRYQLDGKVDLARLARVLPQTVRLRDDTQIVRGEVRVFLSSSSQQQQQVWQGGIQTSNLEAIRQGLRVEWRDPVAVSLAAHQRPGELPTVDDLRCESSFLQVQGSGSLDQSTLTARCDLLRLTQELDQFVELGSVKAAGQAWAKINVRRQPDGRIHTDGRLQLADVRLSGVGPNEIRQPKLEAEWVALGRLDTAGLEQLDTADLQARTGGELIQLELLAPWRPGDNRTDAKFRLLATGDLAAWLAHARRFTSAADGVRLSGKCELRSELQLAGEAMSANKTNLVVDTLRGDVAGVKLNEPRLVFRGNARWEQALGRLELSQCDLESQVLLATSPQLVLVLPPAGGCELQGTVNCRTRLETLQFLLGDDAFAWGTVDATGSFATLDGKLNGKLDLKAADLLLADTVHAKDRRYPSNDPYWVEKSPTAQCRFAYDPANDALTLDSLTVNAQSVKLTAAGKVDRLLNDQQLELKGQAEYDMAKLSQQLQPYLGNGIEMQGREVRPLQFSGSLAQFLSEPVSSIARDQQPPAGWHALRGEAQLAFQSATTYGLQLERAETTIKLEQGWLTSTPLTSAVHGGKLVLHPSMRLSPEPMELIHPPGKVLENVQLTPEICAAALQYVAPVVAGATSAQGQFSVELSSARVPVLDPGKSEAEGKLLIDSASVRGTAWVFELAQALLQSPTQAQIAPNSAIPFQMHQGRVYHRDLVVTFPELPGFRVASSGSVGVDGSLALVAEMPIPPNWLTAAQRAGVSVPRQTLRIPIGGTLDKPRLDRQALERNRRELLRETAGGVIQNQLNKGLDRLFDRNR